jgi:hypothetical protein
MKLYFNVVLNDKSINITKEELFNYTQGDLEIETVKFYKGYINSSPGGASERLQQIRLNTAYFTQDNIPVALRHLYTNTYTL